MTLATPDHHALRAEVGLLRAELSRRMFAARLALGTPGQRGDDTVIGGPLHDGKGDPWPPPAWLDAGMRVDVVDRLLGHHQLAERPLQAWLLRPGVASLHDEDLAWLAATRHACAAHGVALAGFWVVTRYGWLDPVTGASRSWKRLRVRR